MNFKKFVIMVFCMLLVSSLVSGCSRERNGTDSFSTDSYANNYRLLYKDVINDYEKIIDFRLSSTFEDDYNNDRKPVLTKEWANNALRCDTLETEENDVHNRWNCMIIDMLDYISEPAKESFGYIFKDINGDGIEELIWVNAEYKIFCIFTIVDNQVWLVDSFCTRYDCVIQETGELYILKNGGAADNIYTIKKIDSTAGLLVSLLEFGEDGGTYYKKEDNQYCVLTEREYEELCSEYFFAISDHWKENTIHVFKSKGDLPE